MTYGFPQVPDRWEYLIVHCAATPPELDVDAAWVDRIHRQKGWSMCGYHIFIKRDGTVEWEGTGARTRPILKTGSHVGGCGPGWNTRCLSVSMAGGVKSDGRTPADNFTEAQYRSLMLVIAEAMEAFSIPVEKVIGHRDLIKMTRAAPKACPSMSVYAFLNGPFQAFDEYDATDRKAFDWDKATRPAAPKDKLTVRKTYTVQQGDTLWAISRATGCRLSDLRRLNGLTTDVIQPGQRIKLLD